MSFNSSTVGSLLSGFFLPAFLAKYASALLSSSCCLFNANFSALTLRAFSNASICFLVRGFFARGFLGGSPSTGVTVSVLTKGGGDGGGGT